MGAWAAMPTGVALLEARWTHVGYGAQESRDGRLYVVQVFAFDPNPVVFANVTRPGTSSVAVRFEVTSTGPGWVGVTRVGSPVTAVAIVAGETVTLVLEAVDAVVRVLRHASRPPTRDLQLQLAFEGAAHDVAVRVDGRPVDAAVTGTNVVVRLPGGDGVYRVQIGIRAGGDQVAVAHGMRVVVQGERVQLIGRG